MVLIVIPLLDSSVLPCGQIDDQITLLEALYGDTDCQDIIRRELENLYQANREFVAYYADILLIKAELDYNAQAKIHALVVTLSLELREALVIQRLPTTFMSYVTLLTHLDNKCRLFRPAPRAGHTQLPRSRHSRH